MTPKTTTPYRPINVLLVEDNPTDSKLLLDFLREADPTVNVKLLTDGEQAITFLLDRKSDSDRFVPDIVVLDINLPRKSGFEVLSDLRQDPKHTHIPVFLLTSTGNPDDVRRGEALNVSGFFSKPSDMADYEKLTDRLINEEFPKFLPDRVGRGPAFAAKNTARGNELFRQLVEAVRDYAIFALDPQGVILTWNQGAEHLKGYKSEEVIGKHFSVFYPEESKRSNHPSYELEMASKNGRFQEEGWRIRKDGSRFWASVTITSIRDNSGNLIGFGKVTRDFTDREQSEQNLRNSERRFRLLVEGVKDYAIIMLSVDGTIASWNVGAERINGYKAAEVIGRHFSIFYTNQGLEKTYFDNELKIAREKGVYEEEGLRVRKDGSTFWANVSITALYDDNKVLQGFAKVTRDITERKRSEDDAKRFSEELERKVAERTRELELKKKELERQRDQFARSNVDLQQFAFIASHDLQEPLRGIIICHQLLQQRHSDHLTAQMQEYLNLATDSAKRMKRLVEGLLQYGKAGQAIQIESDVDMSAIVSDVLGSLKTLIDENGASVHFEDLPKCSADRALIAQVFQNLISNSIKYRGKSAPQITIRGVKKDGHCEFLVEDNGIGIEQQYFERIFGMFQRLKSGAGSSSGTGIGLAVCKRIIEAHGTKIWLSSKPGVGSTFTFTLPG